MCGVMHSVTGEHTIFWTLCQEIISSWRKIVNIDLRMREGRTKAGLIYVLMLFILYRLPFAWLMFFIIGFYINV